MIWDPTTVNLLHALGGVKDSAAIRSDALGRVHFLQLPVPESES